MFGKRVVTFLIFVLAGLGVYSLRLAQLQLLRGDDYAETISKRLTSRQTLYGSRGDILDRNGKILATDMPCYSFKMDYRAILLVSIAEEIKTGQYPEEIITLGEDKLLDRWIRRQAKGLKITGDIQFRRMEVLKRVNDGMDLAGRISGSGRAALDKIAEGIILRIHRIRKRVGTTISEQVSTHNLLNDLSEQAAVDLRSFEEKLIGGAVGPDILRLYPYGELACHFLGRTGRVTAETVAADPYKDDPLRKYLPDGRVGVSGVEQLCEDLLRPTRGWQQHDSLADKTETLPASRGNDVRMSIDIDLQAKLTQLLNEQNANGAAVIVDIKSGEILASVSKPGYNLNNFNRDFSQLANDDQNHPLLNRVIARLYPPGSTIKPITAVAGLSEHVIDFATEFNCRGHADSRRPRCWSRYGHGNLAVEEAIMQSCNTFFARTAEKLGPDTLAKWFGLFGHGQTLNTGIRGESSALVPDSQWMQQRYGRDFYTGEVRSMSIGQATVLATPLHVANATATIARNGVFITPRIVLDGGPQQIVRDNNVAPEIMAVVREGMRRVVDDPRSQTAYKHINRHPANFAGKTGTAQVGGGKEDMAWFTAFGPTDDPQVAIAIVLEHAGSGGTNCAPVAERIMDICREMGYISGMDFPTDSFDELLFQ